MPSAASPKVRRAQPSGSSFGSEIAVTVHSGFDITLRMCSQPIMPVPMMPMRNLSITAHRMAACVEGWSYKAFRLRAYGRVAANIATPTTITTTPCNTWLSNVLNDTIATDAVMMIPALMINSSINIRAP